MAAIVFLPSTAHAWEQSHRHLLPIPSRSFQTTNPRRARRARRTDTGGMGPPEYERNPPVQSASRTAVHLCAARHNPLTHSQTSHSGSPSPHTRRLGLCKRVGAVSDSRVNRERWQGHGCDALEAARINVNKSNRAMDARQQPSRTPLPSFSNNPHATLRKHQRKTCILAQAERHIVCAWPLLLSFVRLVSDVSGEIHPGDTVGRSY